MGLKVWLPLNGDLHNQGCSEVTATVSGATVNTSGKIGSCYSFDGSDDFISLSGNTLYNIFKGGSQQFSICFWVYHNDATRAIIFGDYGLSGAIGFNIELTTSHGVRFYWNGSPDKNFNSTSYVTAQGWTHIVITYSGSILNIYRNGILSTDSWSGTLAAKNKTAGQFYLGRDNRTGTTALNGRLNDFRIYDHCLSAAEVREISQGLVCHYKLDSINDNIIQDSSGYNGNGEAINSPTISNDTIRYSNSMQFVSGSSQYIRAFKYGKVRDAITVSWWGKATAWGSCGRPISCTESGGWNFERANSGYMNFACGTGTSSNTYKSALGTTALSTLTGWHHFVGTYDGYRTKIYLDGVLETTNEAYAEKTPIYYYSSNGIFIGCEAKTSTTTPNSPYWNGLLSDIRIYATALDADAIRQLYEVGAKVDNKNNIHSFELNENNQNEITKTGILKCSTFSEFNGMSFLKYDPNLYIEPDGSCWIRVFHHNNPGAGSFSSSNDFAHSVYIDENRWFNVELANYLDKWEIMIKGKFTATSDEWKLRWIQQYNPMTATYANVAVANITKITTSGYSSSPAAWGGLYFKNGSTYLCANNGTSGNWWGAVGSYSVYQNGIPGWGPTGTVTTTGFNDVYLRIDNVTFTSPIAKNTKNKIWTGLQIIEL